MITGRQIRAARGLMGWDASALAEKAGLSRETISNIENGAVQAREATLNDIARVFDKHGVEFTDNEGVRLKHSNLEVFEGIDRFDDFYEFLYEHLRRNGGDVCLSIYDEPILAKYRRKPEIHRSRMKELIDRGDVTFRILATKSDFVSYGYAQFRWQQQQTPTPTGFYAFGDCLALMSFVNTRSPYIVVIQSGPLAEGYRQSFENAWRSAPEKPPQEGGEQ